MILYFTYNDQPSGVYWSQVTDVVAYLNTLGGPRVRLFALVSGRDFLKTRAAIKQRLPDAIVLPMVPRMRNWRRNLVLLAMICRLHRPTGIICRGVMTTWMALRLRDRGLVKKVCFDARGAYAAEWEEYRIIDDDELIAQFRDLEADAVNKSDFRLSVSNALVDHWRERYGYTGDAYVVIPCTLGRDFQDELGEPLWIWRKQAWLDNEDVVLAYSGSTAGWQSFARVAELLGRLMEQQPSVSVLFLSRQSPEITALQERFGTRIIQVWVRPEDVRDMLRECDHGLLFREPTVTNSVASPTKFAEYLSCGLPVLISEGLGDFSAMVEREQLGTVIKEGEVPGFLGRSKEQRRRMHEFAIHAFTKGAHAVSYRTILQRLS